MWPDISPDGKKIILSGEDEKQQGIWLYENNKKILLLNGENFWAPVFSRDGKNIYFSKDDDEAHIDNVIYKQGLSGLDEPHRINSSNLRQLVPYLSPSNKYVLFISISERGSPDISYQVMGQDEVKSLVSTNNVELFTALSPDEQFMVFDSEKSGRREIYLTRFPDSGVQRQISIEGGSHPIWRGNEIFYVSLNNELMVIKIDINGPQINIGRPEILFAGNQVGVQLANWFERNYTVSADGQEIVAVFAPQASQYYYVLVENWFEEFRDKN
jgi:Tol biopolymer transport system component